MYVHLNFRSVGLPIHNGIVKALSDEEKYPIEQLIVDDEIGILGPGGARALMTALLGNGPGMKGGPYKLLKSLRFWRTNVGDEGVNAVVRCLQQVFNSFLFRFFVAGGSASTWWSRS